MPSEYAQDFIEDEPPPHTIPYHQSILGRRGILRPIHNREKIAGGIADIKNHREFHGKEVPSWEETRAYWKPRLEAETWDDWLVQGGKKRGHFRPRQRQHAITLRRPLTRSQAERISNLVPSPLRWVEPGEEIISPVLHYLEEHQAVVDGQSRTIVEYDPTTQVATTDWAEMPTAEEGLRRSLQERWVEVDDPTPFTITVEQRQALDEILEEANTRE